MDGRVDTVLIDFYGTITSGDRTAVEAICANAVQRFSLQLSAEELAVRWGTCFFAVLDDSNHGSFRTLMECERISLERTLFPQAGPVDVESFLGELASYWEAPPMPRDAITFLDRIHVPVCCVSNADRSHIERAIRHHGLSFDRLVTSEDARCYKPQRAIFEQALNQMGVPPERAVHVGDSLHSDIQGAAGLGIRTVWVCREDRIHDIGNDHPDLTVTSLDEVPDRLLGQVPLVSRGLGRVRDGIGG